MKELNLNEIRKYELDILIDVAKFCDNNKLRYFIAYGTLIGAVRHKGFIPWDDDIDIQMPRPDYEKFLELYNAEGEKNNIYKAISPYDKSSKHTFIKVVDMRTVKIEKGIIYDQGETLGIDIDVFPLDGQPDEDKEFLKYYYKKYNNYKRFHYIVSSYRNRSWKGKLVFAIPYVINRLVGKRRILDKLNKINKMYPYEKSRFVGNTSSLYDSTKNRMLRTDYDDYVMLDFEGNKFKAPVNYDEMLRKWYGDYMKLPPLEQQKTHHSYKAVLK